MTARHELLTIGEMIEKLRAIEPDRQGPKAVRFDFGFFSPSLEIASYRGYYEDLAFGYNAEEDFDPLVPDLLKGCERIRHQTIEGYKGGTYQVRDSTRLWVSNWGQCSFTGVVDVVDHGWIVIIETRFIP